MAFATTTLTAAVAITDNVIVVASASLMTAGRLILVDQEMMKIGQSYLNGLTIPVLRGIDGTATAIHRVTANVTNGLASDFAVPAPQAVVTYPTARAVVVQSITATSTLALPLAGTDVRVVLNGTSVITLTIPVPTKDMDGTLLTIVGNGAAAHVLTFTGGLSGAGTSYDLVTVNATAPIAMQAMACNGLWMSFTAVPIAGTVTNITGTVA